MLEELRQLRNDKESLERKVGSLEVSVESKVHLLPCTCACLRLCLLASSVFASVFVSVFVSVFASALCVCSLHVICVSVSASVCPAAFVCIDILLLVFGHSRAYCRVARSALIWFQDAELSQLRRLTRMTQRLSGLMDGGDGSIDPNEVVAVIDHDPVCTSQLPSVYSTAHTERGRSGLSSWIDRL